MFLMSIYISICEFLITQTFCKKGVGGGEEEKKVERTPLKNNSIFIDDRFFALALVIRQSVVIYK